jgi:hypothetical protein
VSQPQPSPASTKPIARLGSLSHVRRALRHRNFKLFFAGQGISVIGAWIARGATTRLVYHLTHSALLLGIAGFGLMQCAAASSTIIQSLVTEDMRDRAMGYCTTAFFGAAPFGSLLAGARSPHWSAHHRHPQRRVWPGRRSGFRSNCPRRMRQLGPSTANWVCCLHVP